MKVPSHMELGKIMDQVFSMVFPEYYPDAGVNITYALASQIEKVMDDGPEAAIGMAEAFTSYIPEMSRILHTDVEAVIINDPAVSSMAEVILCYPLTRVMTYFRTAHFLHSKGVALIPRMLSEMAHSQTGIDINPAAKIGEYFCIDHGTGVVIGETCVIGNRVTLYQGVTLGAKNFKYDENGHALNVPRHPILEDNVTVYSNASILGRVRIGHDTVIGGNVWLTEDVPPHSRILQTKAIRRPVFSDGEGI